MDPGANVRSVATAPKLRRAIKAKSPGLHRERALWADGHEVVVGIDEVGKGAWAGPLTLGAVVVPKDRRVYKIRDSKMLTEAEREALFDRVVDWAEAWAVGHASAAEWPSVSLPLRAPYAPVHAAVDVAAVAVAGDGPVGAVACPG